MKELSHNDALEVISACFDLLAKREKEIRRLYNKLQKYETIPGTEGKMLGPITPDTDEASRNASPQWPGAIAVCGTPLVGRSLMLLCPQMGLRILGITDSGLNGLSLAEQHKPAFAFIDLDVNDIDGLVLISRMKDIAPDMILLALSAGKQESTLVSAVIAGARDVIAKPLQAARVLDIVKRLKKERRPLRDVPSGSLPEKVNPMTVQSDREGWMVL
ncbi:MAG: response regulator [bacterium]